ncbi:hypothetical protein PG990_006957 [Apiospora arundinis]
MILRYDFNPQCLNETNPAQACLENRPILSRDTHTLVSIWSLTGIAFVFALGRFYVRGYMAGKLRSDDYLIMLTLSCMVASCSLSTKAVTYGLGRHVETVSHQDQIEVVKWIYLASCPGVLSLAVPKLAVITLLIRILVPGKAHRRFLWAMGIAVQLFFMIAVAMFLRVLIGKCPPFQEGQIPHNCVPPAMQVRYCLFAGSASAFVDFYLAIYPSTVLYKLQMPLRKKAALSIALGLGVFSGAAAIYKTTHLPALASPDFIFANAGLMEWTVVESTSIVIASCIPVIQPLMQTLFGFSVLGRRLKTVQKPYIMAMAHRGKIATAIRRRIGEANNIDNLTELREDMKAEHHQDGSTRPLECVVHSTSAASYQHSEIVVQGK